MECWPKHISYTVQCLVIKLKEFYLKLHGLHIDIMKKYSGLLLCIINLLKLKKDFMYHQL
jgi:hypothetical protein